MKSFKLTDFENIEQGNRCSENFKRFDLHEDFGVYCFSIKLSDRTLDLRAQTYESLGWVQYFSLKVQENKQNQYKLIRQEKENSILNIDNNDQTNRNNYDFLNLENIRDDRINFIWREKIFPNFES